jgi:hypothetical protein
VQVGGGHVGQVGGPDHSHSQAAEPAASRGQVRDLEYRHVAAVTAAPLKVSAGGGVRPGRRHHFQECVANREYRIGQAEPSHSRIVKWLRPAKGVT